MAGSPKHCSSFAYYDSLRLLQSKIKKEPDELVVCKLVPETVLRRYLQALELGDGPVLYPDGTKFLVVFFFHCIKCYICYKNTQKFRKEENRGMQRNTPLIRGKIIL